MHAGLFKFVHSLAVNTWSRLGTALATSSLVLFAGFELMRIAGVLTSAYIGLVTYMAFPALFIVGLALISIGWLVLRRGTGMTIRELLTKNIPLECRASDFFGSRFIRMTVLLTAVNLLFLGGVSLRGAHLMEQPVFCGTACHRVMNPEWTTYRLSPHARVKCVECHVGEGTRALIDSKLNGLWQIISATFDLYERPIPTPVRNLRPARETCEKCHWPDKFHGNRMRHFVNYGLDSASTPRYTTLLMKIGSGREGLDRGSHWHVAARNRVVYSSVNDEREAIIWVEVQPPDGEPHRFRNAGLPSGVGSDPPAPRVMDCVDCHNRATHIYEDPERAVDERIRRGELDLRLPFIKRRMLGAVLIGADDPRAAMKNVAAHIRNYFRRDYVKLFPEFEAEIDRAVRTAQAIYARNIHPRMKVGWGSYPNHLGHRSGGGCFRCHSSDMVDDKGESVSMECTLCHSIVAYDEDDPYKYLLPLEEDTSGISREMHRTLQREFGRAMKD